MTATKLTKTQREVLEQADRHPKGRAGVHAWTQAVGGWAKGRQKSGGLRKHSAIQALVEAGLLDGYKVYHHSGYAPGGEWNNGHVIYSSEAVAYITDAGRAVIEA